MSINQSRDRQALRPWQRDALAAWIDSGKRGIVEVATGGGKTHFALACALSSSDDLGCVEVVVPTTALADQWYLSITEDAGVDPRDIAFLTSKSRGGDLRRFNVVVINSAREIDPQIWTGRRRFLVVDECHRAGSLSNSKALSGETVATLGLSATPDRQYDEALTEVLIPHLGPIIYRYGLRDAIRDGVLNDFALSNVRVTLTADESDAYDKLSRRIAAASGRNSEELRTQLLRARARVSTNALSRLPTAVRMAEQNRGSRALIFHESIDGAESIFRMLRARNHAATLYHSRLGPHLRRENLRLFRSGVYDILVTCRALDEGINIPEVEVAVVAAASASDRQRIQRLGRVLRPAPNKGIAQVYTLFATAVEEERLRAEATDLQGVAQVTWLEATVS